MRVGTVAAAVAGTLAFAAAVLAATASAATSHPATTAAACSNGVADRIGGRAVCIHVGGKCVAAHNAKYRARGFTCVKGRLRRIVKPAISIGDASAAEGNSGTTTVPVPVNLSAATTSTVTVDYATSDGSATAGSDYTAASGTVTFRPGETQKTIPISIVGDTSIEANETLTVTLSNAVNAKIAAATATVTITNDDTAVAISAGSYKGATQNGNFVFFTLKPDRTITGFRVNDLPETCDPGGIRLLGGIDFGDNVFPVNADGRVNVHATWSGSFVSGDAEWTSEDTTIAASFNNPTAISGTITEIDELNYKGTHYRCSSGQITWSATRQG
jgi:Calx-beta domain-containing protein